MHRPRLSQLETTYRTYSRLLFGRLMMMMMMMMVFINSVEKNKLCFTLPPTLGTRMSKRYVVYKGQVKSVIAFCVNR